MVESEQLLGLRIDQNIHRTIADYLALLCRIKKNFPFQTRKSFYNCYILPHMDYCSTTSGNAPSSERILKLQKRAARITTDTEYRAESAPLLKQLRWPPLPERIKYRQAQLVYKSVKGLAHNTCERCFSQSQVSLIEALDLTLKETCTYHKHELKYSKLQYSSLEQRYGTILTKHSDNSILYMSI